MTTLAVLIILVAVASAAPPPLPDFLKDVNNRDAVRACGQALRPDPAQRDLVQGCVDSQGLTEETINDIRALAKDAMKEGGPNPAEGLKERIFQALRDAEQTEAAERVMECVANENGYVVDGVFNMDAFKTEMLARATGSDVGEKIRNAMETCPPVEGFDVPSYMKCVMETCAGVP